MNYECLECGNKWEGKEEMKGVFFPLLVCPKCKEEHCLLTGTMGNLTFDGCEAVSKHKVALELI